MDQTNNLDGKFVRSTQFFKNLTSGRLLRLPSANVSPMQDF